MSESSGSSQVVNGATAAALIPCGHCSAPISPELWNRDGVSICLACGNKVTVAVFPAILHKPAGLSPEALEIESEASCFYHAQSRAAVPCEECGRFLCRLCDLEIEGRHLCPACFQNGVRTRKLENLEMRRTMYDSIALALATLPALLVWPVLFTAPASLFIVIRRWRAPGSLAPRTRIRFYLAALFALAEITGVIFIFGAIFRLSGRAGAR